jgi:TonB family protein
VNKFLHILERYQYGIIAAIAIYIGCFIYLEMETYTRYFDVKPFFEENQVEIESEFIEIPPESIVIDMKTSQGEVKNMSRSMQDTRERSLENWTQNQASGSSKSAEQKVRDYEKSLFEQAGGASERQRIQKEMDLRKNQQNNAVNTTKVTATTTNGGKTAYAGNVMVDWSLPNRMPHQNNNWFVRNPGYTCGYGASGKVTVKIVVNQNGDVTNAVPIEKSTASECMIEQAVKYAKLSRFNYAGNDSKSQNGTITYTFVSQ